MQNAAAVRNAFAVALSRVAQWIEGVQAPGPISSGIKFTDSLERELCEREARRRSY